MIVLRLFTYIIKLTPVFKKYLQVKLLVKLNEKYNQPCCPNKNTLKSKLRNKKGTFRLEKIAKIEI